VQLTNIFSVQCKLTVISSSTRWCLYHADRSKKGFAHTTIDRHSHKRNYTDISHSVPIQVFPISSPATAHTFPSPPVVSVRMDSSVVENMWTANGDLSMPNTNARPGPVNTWRSCLLLASLTLRTFTRFRFKHHSSSKTSLDEEVITKWQTPVANCTASAGITYLCSFMQRFHRQCTQRPFIRGVGAGC